MAAPYDLKRGILQDRAMLTGLNTEIPYKGICYHVQTEDGGLTHPVMTTLIFKDGAVLFSKKTNYAALKPSGPDVIHALMKEQHKTVLKDLVAGRIPLSPTPRPDI